MAFNTAAASTTRELKHRLYTCLTKLSDRDTYALASAELESIAKSIPPSSLSIFLSCIHSTNSSADKSPVRKQCVNLLGVLSQSHGPHLSPHLSKMIAAVLRRIRDPDSSVRSACVHVISLMSLHIKNSPFSAFLKPLSEAVFTEQDYNAQLGSALCLSAAIDSSEDPDVGLLRKMLPRFEKLLKVDSFKPKQGALALIGSVIEVRAASGGVKNLVACLADSLKSEDWAVRKAAAESLTKLALAEREALSEFKAVCLKNFESRRFDKVKGVREAMNGMLEAWKEVPDLCDEASSPPQSPSSSKENASDGRCLQVDGKQRSISRLSPCDASLTTTGRKRSPLKSSDRNRVPSTLRRMDTRQSDQKAEVSVHCGSALTGIYKSSLKGKDENGVERRVTEKSRLPKPETRRILFPKNYDDNMLKSGGSKSGSRVVPYHEESSESNAVISKKTEDLGRSQRESEDLSLIRQQLAQIENQQSSLLDLLQGFIGSSTTGLHSLETRVHGLELALNEISYDLAASKGRMATSDFRSSTCCLFPGTEYLSSRFWRRTEARNPTSRDYTAGRNVNAESLRPENQRFQLGSSGRLIVNPLADPQSYSVEASGASYNRISRNPQRTVTRTVNDRMAN